MNSKRIIAIIIILQLIVVSQAVAITISIDSQNPITFNKGILYVGGSGPGNYSNIQDAIDNATSSDTVFVYSGVYFENIIINTSIYLIGEHRNTTIIDGMEVGHVVELFADNIVFCNFSVQNAGNPYYGNNNGINIHSNGNTIKYNKIGPKNFVGIGVWANNNTIYRNTFFYNFDALALSDSFQNEVIENNIGFSDLAGINIFDSHDNLIQRNNFIFNGINTMILGNSIELTQNNWEENYWSIPLHKPKHIPTFIFPFKFEFQYDQTPALHPNGKLHISTYEENNSLIILRGRVKDLFNTSSWDGVGIKMGRLSSIGIIVNYSLEESLHYTIATGLSLSSGRDIGYSEILLENAIGIFWRPRMNLLPNKPPKLFVFCFAEKFTDTFHYYSFNWN